MCLKMLVRARKCKMPFTFLNFVNTTPTAIHHQPFTTNNSSKNPSVWKIWNRVYQPKNIISDKCPKNPGWYIYCSACHRPYMKKRSNLHQKLNIPLLPTHLINAEESPSFSSMKKISTYIPRPSPFSAYRNIKIAVTW